MTKNRDREYALAREYQEELLMGEAVANIEGLLESLDIPRKELAHRLGISQGRVSQMLSGERNLTLRTLGAMAWALGASIDVSLRELEDRSTSPASADPHLPSWATGERGIGDEGDLVDLENDSDVDEAGNGIEHDMFEGWTRPVTYAATPAPQRDTYRRRHTYTEVSPDGEKELAA